MVALHTAIAIILVIGLIIRFKVDPVISLIIASLYLGLASGVGFAETVGAITTGFGDIMAKVGLLIGFGVLIGSLLHSMGTFRKLVAGLLHAFGARRIPYAMTTAMATIFPSIYVDVQVVLAAPVARSAAPHLGTRGLPLMAGAIGTGIFAGYGADRSEEALKSGFHTTGEILLVTGIGGSLGAVIDASGLGDQLGGLFSADAGAPVLLSILLAWFIAALLHLAIGSVSVAAIAAAGIIAPVLGQINVTPIVIGLAIASGSLFALQVNSNFFWMFRSLLGLSTQGALKTLTTVTSIASLVSLPIVVALGLVL